MLIDETNWKQELAKLKAKRLLLEQELYKLAGLWNRNGTSDELVARVSDIENEGDVLDKAIETIENVFVHKRCYI